MKYCFLSFLLLLVASDPGLARQNGADGFVQSGTAEIHYKTFGEGAPLLIINGGPGMSSEGFIPLARELSADNRTILFDQRGTGRSKLDRIDGSTVTMDLMVEDMEALRTHLGLDSWIIMGHSFGGMLAAYYTARHPEKVDGIIFSSSGGLDLGLLSYVNIGSRLSTTERDSLSYWNRRIAGGDTSYHARLQRGRFLAPAYVYDKTHVPAIAERLTQGNSVINSLVWADLQRIGFDTKEELRDFQKPVLIIQGKEDIIREETARAAARVLRNSTVVLLNRSGHYGWLDRRERYFDEIRSFLRQFQS